MLHVSIRIRRNQRKRNLMYYTHARVSFARSYCRIHFLYLTIRFQIKKKKHVMGRFAIEQQKNSTFADVARSPRDSFYKHCLLMGGLMFWSSAMRERKRVLSVTHLHTILINVSLWGEVKTLKGAVSQDFSMRCVHESVFPQSKIIMFNI